MQREESIKLPVCVSCKRVIMPNDKAVKFHCPKCSSYLIWRCEYCREFANVYRCSICGFEGP